MIGALLVLVGMTAFLLGGVVWLIEATDPVYGSIEAEKAGETGLLLTIGMVLTFAGGIVLLLSPARRLA
jgi:hypothetical protein